MRYGKCVSQNGCLMSWLAGLPAMQRVVSCRYCPADSMLVPHVGSSVPLHTLSSHFVFTLYLSSSNMQNSPTGRCMNSIMPALVCEQGSLWCLHGD